MSHPSEYREIARDPALAIAYALYLLERIVEALEPTEEEEVSDDRL
jgi:hypothetical protein